MEILQTLNLPALLIQLGLLIVSVIGVHQATKRAYERKQDEFSGKIELKADNSKVDKMADSLIKKADVSYVDKEIRGVHHRIDETTNFIKEGQSQIMQQQKEMQKDIKELLKKSN